MTIQFVVLGPECVLHQRLLGRRHAVRLGREVVVGELEKIFVKLQKISASVTWSLTCLSSGLVSAWPAYTALLLRPREGVLAPWAPPWPPPTSCRDDDGSNQGDYDKDDNY